jgi:hypothetical protein
VIWRETVIAGTWAQSPDDRVLVRTTESKTAAAARIGAGLAIREQAGLMGILEPCFARTGTWLHAGKYIPALVGEVPKLRTLSRDRKR